MIASRTQDRTETDASGAPGMALLGAGPMSAGNAAAHSQSGPRVALRYKGPTP